MFSKTNRQKEAIKLLAGDATHNLLDGGSRSGKTFITLYAVVCRALKMKSRHLVVRFRFNHIKSSVWYDTFPKMMGICFPELKYTENKSDWFITLPNGSEIWFGGLDDKERTEKILGNEYSTIYYNEVSQISYDSVSLCFSRLAENSGLKLKFYYDCNPPSKKHWVFKMFYLNRNPEDGSILDASDYVKIKMNPKDNLQNLPQKYLDILNKYPKKKRDRFLYGLYGEDNENALWQRDWIDSNRRFKIPDLQRIVVGVDPAASNTDTSDEHGIVVSGVVREEGVDHFYVLDDVSTKGSPKEWGSQVLSVYYKYKADCIVAEKNNGGDMVKDTIKNLDNNAKVDLVWASRGKHVRAEPISALYEEGRAHHAQMFEMMEDELCDWNPVDSNYSPNRLDALVWSLTELTGTAPTRVIKTKGW